MGSTGRWPVLSGGPPERSRGASGKAAARWPGLARRSGERVLWRQDPATFPPRDRSLREMFPAGRRKRQASGLCSPDFAAARAMRILALQLKRIGDLVLTTPALAALRAAWPEAHIALAVAPGCAPLLGSVPSVSAGVVLGKGRGFAPWQQVLTGAWDLCVDFTGTDRSALAAGLSRATERATFAWVKKSKLRAVAFNYFVESAVRERHTADHYLDLVDGILAGRGVRQTDGGRGRPRYAPELTPPPAALAEAARLTGDTPFAVIHPGTARAEKYWVPERWAEVIAHVRERHGLECVLTGGADEFECVHLADIQTRLAKPALDLAGKIDLATFAAVLARARLCVSCDTGAVHLAAAARTPQVALFGPTNPFHWHPRHDRALVLSAAQPDAPLTAFHPRMKGAPMERISTELVIGAIAQLIPTP